ncbi:MAG TPA: STAS domain-containing protein [Anaerolineae bacterium]|nr:STAS domain-containing protein [Anaerolineae bacterium]HNU03001.1 STAS domain-containing protein [Anaerolineae bacterium]
MEITSESFPSCAVVHPVGTLDRRSAPELEAVLQALAGQGQSRVVLDLSDVGEMSSAGLRVIISAAKLLRSERLGGDLRLAAPSVRVVQVLELAGLLPVLKVFDADEPAIASFADPPPARKRA